jgi:TrmH family RNA methyltransferase
VNSISSRQNPFVQRCRDLARRRDAQRGDILLDGLHLLSDALAAGVPIAAAAATTHVWQSQEGASLLRRLEAAGTELFEATGAVIEAASPVRTSSGLVAIGRWHTADTDAIFSGPIPKYGSTSPALVVCVVHVQDPGNVGAIIRAAEAAGASGVVVAAGSADPLGWKALRGSMGSAFRLPVAAGVETVDVCASARDHGVDVVATSPADGVDLYEFDLTGPVLVLVGGEGAGLPAEVGALAHAAVRIPMRAPVESLNVAVATGIILFEAQRQRRAVTSR